MNRFFKEGFKDGLAIGLGYLSVSFAFGIFTVGQGLNVWQAVVISITNLTSAGQLAAVPIIAASGSFAELALTQLVINLRYALMSISLSQKLDADVRMRDRFLMGYAMTDAKGEDLRHIPGIQQFLVPQCVAAGPELAAVAGDVAIRAADLPQVIQNAAL